MNSIVLEDLSLVTVDLLERTGAIKNIIINSMMSGQDYIIIGVELFEKILKENNPSSINNDVILEIKKEIDNILSTNHNRYVSIGVSRCFMMLEAYNIIKSRYCKKRVKIID